jgi:hypothetical protein
VQHRGDLAGVAAGYRLKEALMGNLTRDRPEPKGQKQKASLAKPQRTQRKSLNPGFKTKMIWSFFASLAPLRENFLPFCKEFLFLSS